MGQGYIQAGTFWGAFKISLRAYGGQLELDITDLFFMEIRYVTHGGPQLPSIDGETLRHSQGPKLTSIDGKTLRHSRRAPTDLY